MSRIDELAVLKTLDPAEGDVDLYCPRALTDLQRILASDPTVPTVRPQQSRRKRIALAIGLVAAATAAAFVLPTVLGGDQAIANWTAEPTALSPQETARAAATCRTKMGESGARYGGMDAHERAALSAATVTLAEKRGPWTMVVLTGRDGMSALCIDDRIAPGSKWFMGSAGASQPHERPGARELDLRSFGTATLNDRELSMAVGLAGSDVTGVSYLSATRGRVKGTVTKGQFALWLPGDDMKDAGDVGVPLQVTYRDGSTATLNLP